MKTTNKLLIAGIVIAGIGFTSCSSERPQSDYGYYETNELPVMEAKQKLENKDSVLPLSMQDTLTKNTAPEIVVTDSINR